jgi:hypothetical protein
MRRAQHLDLPLAYSTNGDGIPERDLHTGIQSEVAVLPAASGMGPIPGKGPHLLRLATVLVSAAKRDAPGRTRTSDTRFRKPLLYPLSYEGAGAP